MECRWHPGMPGVGYCQKCHVFVCRVCADLSERPLMCTDCVLEDLRVQVAKLRQRLWRAVAGGVLGFVVGFLLLGRFTDAPGVMVILGGVALGWVVCGALLIDIYGLIFPPWGLRRLVRRISALQVRIERIVAIQEAGAEAPDPRRDEEHPPPDDDVDEVEDESHKHTPGERSAPR